MIRQFAASMAAASGTLTAPRVDPALFVHQIGKRHMVDHITDRPIDLLPEIQRHTVLAARALVDLVIQTRNRCNTALHKAENLPNSVILGVIDQMIAPLGTADTFDKTATHQNRNDLLQILFADPVNIRNRFDREIDTRLLHGQLQHQVQRVTAFCRYFHTSHQPFQFPIVN